ncbi:MAG: transposase [Lewinella sp.]|nr:transposase [Lewinella sp.]
MKQQLESGQILPRSPLGQALGCAMRRWEGLCAYAHDGQLEIDNNLVENIIRPVALGHKNYLFASSDEADQTLACLYSIIGTANKHGFNVHKYLTWSLRKVACSKVTPDTIEWLPYRMNPEMHKDFYCIG